MKTERLPGESEAHFQHRVFLIGLAQNSGKTVEEESALWEQFTAEMREALVKASGRQQPGIPLLEHWPLARNGWV